MGMRYLFTDHPNSVGETYAQHARVATGFGWRMVVAGFACMLHALFPFLFIKTGSRCIEQLHLRMVSNRIRCAEQKSELPAASKH
jgi:hypothetical protein